ncbi:hypothetical protein BOTBODRAFT_147267 [Botryobasidium botryosum FD-172 SS1]|uniref:DUF6589 domain-containing protein n=1 Tax=Botryobasidium botryosum (strain FD-172 SS1) TaxID=930990 RepID=A0A067M787_BOTB1|nr:hypothetical protein BOTBODRAFT_147267 [Botryobasidium botryosum FD-172 SS1]
MPSSPPEPLENPIHDGIEDGVAMDCDLNEPLSSSPMPLDEPLPDTPTISFPFLSHLGLSPSLLNITPPRVSHFSIPRLDNGIPPLELPPAHEPTSSPPRDLEATPHSHATPPQISSSSPLPPSSPIQSPLPSPVPITPSPVHAALASPAPLPLTEGQKIDAIFELITLYFGSLGLFLIAVFSSTAYGRHRGQFCRTHLLTVLGILWNYDTGRKYLLPWALQRVGDDLWKELQRFGKRLVVGYKKITRAFLKNYSISRLSEWLARDAPHFCSLFSVLLTRVRDGMDVDEESDDDDSVINDKDMITTFIACVIARTRGRKQNAFQWIIGLYLYASSCKKRTINLLSRLGVSVSHSSLLRAFDSFSADVRTFIKAAVTLPFLVVCDNININARVVEQRITNSNAYQSGTAATLLPIWGEYPPSSSAHDRVYVEPRPNQPIPPLRIEDLMIPPEKVTEMNEYFKHLLLVILFEHGGKYFSGCKPHLQPPPPIHQIPLHKTERFPLETVNIEEVSREGNINILHDVYVRQLGLSPDTIPSSTHYVHGDLLTVQRLQSAHLGKLNQSDPAVLYRHNADLHRKNISLNKNLRYHQGLDLVLVSLYARVLTMWIQAAGFATLDAFASSKPTMAQLVAIRDKIWSDWLSPRVLDKLRRQRDEKADHVLYGSLVFVRDALLLMTFNESVRIADTGRIFDVLGYWGFMFKAAGNGHYAKELLAMRRCFLVQPKAVTQLILDNWLVNIEGRVRKWIPVDLLQEYMVKWIKAVYSPDGSNFDWELLKKLSVVIVDFRKHITNVEQELQAAYTLTGHTSP